MEEYQEILQQGLEERKAYVMSRLIEKYSQREMETLVIPYEGVVHLGVRVPPKKNDDNSFHTHSWENVARAAFATAQIYNLKAKVDRPKFTPSGIFVTWITLEAKLE